MSKTSSGWRPIESAPRDATWILLWDDRACGAVSGYWDADVDAWMTDIDVCDGDFLPTLWLSVPHPTLCEGGRDE